MAHTHGTIGSDIHFSIDPTTRMIIKLTEAKPILVKGEHNATRYSFELPSMINGHDMSKCNEVQVHYLNIDKVTKEINEGVYEVTDLQISDGNTDRLTCSWLISGNAVQFAGPLNFSVHYGCRSDNMTDYVWPTEIFEGIIVSDGIDNSDVVMEDYADILFEWKAKLEANLIVDLQQTKTSDTEGGINIWTATFGDGRKSELKVRNGYTPKRGTDYWTEEDKKEIAEDVEASVSEELDKRQILYVVSFDSSTGTLVTKTADYTG